MTGFGTETEGSIIVGGDSDFLSQDVNGSDGSINAICILFLCMFFFTSERGRHSEWCN